MDTHTRRDNADVPKQYLPIKTGGIKRLIKANIHFMVEQLAALSKAHI